MIPKPQFLQKTMEEVGIGTFKDIATVQDTATLYDALSVFVERRVSALPVVDIKGMLKPDLLSGLLNILPGRCPELFLFSIEELGVTYSIHL